MTVRWAPVLRTFVVLTKNFWMYCIAVSIRVLARAFEDMRAAGLDDSAIARLLRYAVEELDKHAIEEFEELGGHVAHPKKSLDQPNALSPRKIFMRF